MGGDIDPNSLSGVFPMWIDLVEKPNLDFFPDFKFVYIPDLNNYLVFCI